MEEEQVRMKRKGSRWICSLLLVVLAVLTITDRAYASPEIEESIKQKQEAIKQAEEDKKKMQSGLTDIKKIVSSLQTEKSDIEAYVTKLDANLDDIQQKIDELKEMITEKEEQIETTTKELDAAQKKEKEQYEDMKARIKFLYEKGDTFYLELLFDANGYTDFINKADYINKLSSYDQNMLTEYKENCQLIEACREELEAEQDVLTEAKKKVDAEQLNLEGLIATKEQEINKYEGDISNKQQAIKEYEADIAAQTATIQALEQAVAEEKRKLEAENQTAITYDGGMFKWPAPSYTRISDDYGTRIHPILGVTQFHNGVDMAAPGGSPILAAYDGEVVSAAYNSSMGNYIMINHGDGLYTIYMHASALYVSTGSTVARGDKIAAVGSTGRSTGNHLHFSVRQNGSYVSPWNFLSK